MGQRPQREESEPLRMAELSLRPSPSQAFGEVAVLGLRQSPKCDKTGCSWPPQLSCGPAPRGTGSSLRPWGRCRLLLQPPPGLEPRDSSGGLNYPRAVAFRKQQQLRAHVSSPDLCSWGKPCWELISSCCRGRWDHHAWGTGGGRGTPFHELFLPRLLESRLELGLTNARPSSHREGPPQVLTADRPTTGLAAQQGVTELVRPPHLWGRVLWGASGSLMATMPSMGG